MSGILDDFLSALREALLQKQLDRLNGLLASPAIAMHPRGSIVCKDELPGHLWTITERFEISIDRQLVTPDSVVVGYSYEDAYGLVVAESISAALTASGCELLVVAANGQSDSLELAYGLRPAYWVDDASTLISKAIAALAAASNKWVIDHPRRCLINDELLIFPLDGIGVLGVLYGRNDGRVELIGSANRSIAARIWAHYKGYRTGFNRARFLFDVKVSRIREQARIDEMLRSLDLEFEVHPGGLYLPRVALWRCLFPMWKIESQQQAYFEFALVEEIEWTDEQR